MSAEDGWAGFWGKVRLLRRFKRDGKEGDWKNLRGRKRAGSHEAILEGKI